ncbi:MAG: hypothetical protein R3D30_10800 [Hyphomicrobiales bacterium]
MNRWQGDAPAVAANSGDEAAKGMLPAASKASREMKRNRAGLQVFDVDLITVDPIDEIAGRTLEGDIAAVSADFGVLASSQAPGNKGCRHIDDLTGRRSAEHVGHTIGVVASQEKGCHRYHQTT